MKKTNKTCYGEHKRCNVTCDKKDCRLWIDYKKDLNCTIICVDNNGTLTLAEAPTGISATLAGNISNAEFKGPIGAGQVIADVVNQSGFSYQFRTGHLVQKPVSDIYTGAGSLSISSSLGP